MLDLTVLQGGLAGHASLPWPDDPLLQLWHAQTLLREFRGDIHIAAMTADGIDGCEALVCHAASEEIEADFRRQAVNPVQQGA